MMSFAVILLLLQSTSLIVANASTTTGEPAQTSEPKTRTTPIPETTSTTEHPSSTFIPEIPTTAVPTTAVPTTVVPTTSIPETTTEIHTTPVPTTAVPITVVPTTSIPVYDCCDHFNISYDRNTQRLPSEDLVISASCTCETNNKTLCPVVIVNEEAQAFLSFEEIIQMSRNVCMVNVIIKAMQNKFNKRSIDVPLTVHELEEQHQMRFRFQKSGNNEMCNEDLDCWHSFDQICVYGQCSCYEDVPSFVKEQQRCFPDSKYGESCMYDEQCETNDEHTLCNDIEERCKCKDGYIKSHYYSFCIPETTTEIPTTAVPTTVVPTTSIPVTTTVPTTPVPVSSCCDNFNMSTEPTVPLLPSESFVILASCSCETNNKTYCPVIVVGEEAKEFVSFDEDFVQNPKNICKAQVTIKALQSRFDQRSIEVPLTVHSLNESHPLTFRFQKSFNMERCKEDIDCWLRKDQMCDHGRCSCYEDVPSFVQVMEKCFTASKYGEFCQFDEQCMTRDNQSICGDDHNRCKCKDGCWINSDSDPACICSHSLSAKVFANQFMVYVTAISSVILFFLMM